MILKIPEQVKDDDRDLTFSFLGIAGAVLAAKLGITLAASAFHLNPNLVEVTHLITDVPLTIALVTNSLGLTVTSLVPPYNNLIQPPDPKVEAGVAFMRKVFFEGTLLSIAGIAVRFAPQIGAFLQTLH
jgi:hypothetical protein